MTTDNRLFIIDGHALAYRAYFALGDAGLSTSSGEPTGAVQGFISVMLKLLEQDEPAYLAVSWDVGRTFREDIDPDYKGTREKMPDDLALQIDRIQQVLTAFNVPQYSMENYEADDVIGAISAQSAAQGTGVVIVTGDRDLLQLVTDKITVRLPSGRGIADSRDYAPADVKEKYGVTTEQFVDYKAMVGDSSDNIPGVAGIGVKTAAKLLSEYPSLDAIYENIDNIKGSTQKKLRTGHEMAYHSQRLSRIVTDLDVNFELDACKAPSLTQFPPNYDRDAVVALFRQLEFVSLIRRLPDGSSTPGDTEEGQLALFGSRAADAPSAPPPGPSLTTTTTVINKAGLDACVAALNAAEVVAFDTETDSLRKMEANLVGVSLAVTPGEAWYIPVGHQPDAAPDGQLPLQTVLDALRGPLTDPDIAKVAHNAKYDYVVLQRHGLTVSPMSSDTMLAAWLRTPDSRHLGLKSMASDRLGVLMTEIKELIGTGKKQITFDAVPLADAAPYAAADADITLRLLPLVQQDLTDADAEQLFREVEMPLVPVLSRMEMHGIMIDEPVLSEMAATLESEINANTTAIHQLVGYEFNINSTQQLAQALFTDLELVPPKGTRKTKSGHYSTAAAVLEEMAEQHDVVRKILDLRELAKLKSTYVDALPTYVNAETGRIHTTYAQHGSVTGRIASSDPNLQNIPIRTELGRQVRKAFVAPPGSKLIAIDYSQIELRVAAHLSEDAFMMQAFVDDRDIHAATAAAVFNVPLDAVNRDQRRQAKAVNFGLLYGMGRFRLAQQTGITLGEAEEFIETYFERIPGIKRYIEDTVRMARKQGYVATILGRRRYFPAFHHPRANPGDIARSEREAVNSPIQGSAADIIKLAMLKLHDVLPDKLPNAKMLLQVHDELVFEAPDADVDATVALARDIMQSAYELRVPLKVDAKVGQDWYDMDAV